MIDIPLTEAERMQARAHAYNLTVLRWALGGLVALALVLGLTCEPALSTGRAEKAEAALRECQRQHAPSRVESATSANAPKGGE